MIEKNRKAGSKMKKWFSVLLCVLLLLPTADAARAQVATMLMRFSRLP